MYFSRAIMARCLQVVLVGACFVVCCMAYPSRSNGGDSQHGVIPLGLFMSKLQVDMPDYQAEALSGGRFTGGIKRKRHGHGLLFNPAKTQSQERESSKSCCPTIEEIIEPVTGRSKSGHQVELFQTDDLRQQFHEISCAPTVLEEPCKYVDESVRDRSRCVQQYSYSYALVKDIGAADLTNPASGWRFEHIRVRSGCSCVISST